MLPILFFTTLKKPLLGELDLPSECQLKTNAQLTLTFLILLIYSPIFSPFHPIYISNS